MGLTILIELGRQAEKDGDPDGGIWSAGQTVGLIDDIPSGMRAKVYI